MDYIDKQYHKHMDFLFGDHSRELSGIWDSKGEAYKGLLETVQWVFLRKESERFHSISFFGIFDDRLLGDTPDPTVSQGFQRARV